MRFKCVLSEYSKTSFTRKEKNYRSWYILIKSDPRFASREKIMSHWCARQQEKKRLSRLREIDTSIYPLNEVGASFIHRLYVNERNWKMRVEG